MGVGVYSSAGCSGVSHAPRDPRVEAGLRLTPSVRLVPLGLALVELPIVRPYPAIGAVVLSTIVAVDTLATAIALCADAYEVAYFDVRHGAPDSDGSTDNLVA